tara:strand:- start:1567 stop:1959 length:393 start_codon:yes stop_codon:yes gene_type:complete
MNKISKLARASATVAKEARTAAAKARAEKRVNLERIIRDGDPDSKAVKNAKKQLREMDKKEAAQEMSRRARQGASQSKRKVDLPPLKSEMAYGGSVKGKKHMYAAGGAVMDNLTSAQKNMVKKMAAANKK